MPTILTTEREPDTLAVRPSAPPARASLSPTLRVAPPLSKRLHYAAGAVHRALADAPVGGHALLEAALAWQYLRPTGDAYQWPLLAAQRHLPIVEAPSEAVAARVARLLSGLTWAIITRVEADGSAAAGTTAARVEVPRVEYHRVLRALTGTWRNARRHFDSRSPGSASDPGAAVALWRMALLIAGAGPGRSIVHLHTAKAAAQILAAAARSLGLTPTMEPVHSGRVVALYDPDEVHWLLAEAGSLGATTRSRPGRRVRAAK
ncbi:hypothetical protein [Micromonospora sp. CB01531]|uniref:hypothetical protein n=1 Tax=Micromonospora sp. CB01531 TaxID=1718947 RepID=UPI00093CAF7F|nr:hypothetical protein [Micromonospora sp. CB01531]OKI48977.1 hypothetical protein A6A27_36225 [Micromonospora sp. CB01531]